MTYEVTLEGLRIACQPVRDKDTDALFAEAKAALRRSHCNVAFLGEWSRGKSSLVNALVGRDLLPVDVRPTTASIVTLRAGPVERADVVATDGSIRSLPLDADALRAAQTVATGGSQDARRVDLVLRDDRLVDVRLIDTPGVNDLADLAGPLLYELLPQVDLAVVVLDGTNGGMSRTEEQFLSENLIGDLRPPLAFVVNHMDRVEAEDADELDEMRREFERAVLQVADANTPLVFGSCFPSQAAAVLAAQLWQVVGASSAHSVSVRRARTVAALKARLDETLAGRLQALGQDEAALVRRINDLARARQHIEPALDAFRAHVVRCGAEPLKELVARSLAEHRERTSAEMRRRVGMAGDLGAYAAHGLVADVEGASRAWSQRHLPEVATYLRRHLAFVDQEFRRSFGAALGPELATLRIRVPEPEPLPEVDAEAVQAQQRSAETARYILPGVLTVLGSMIAAPLGIVGLYLGMKIASDQQGAARETIRRDLLMGAERLVAADVARTESALHEAIERYYEDLDRQLGRAFKGLLDDRERQLAEAAAIRARGEDAARSHRVQIEQARTALQAQ